jgi:hypothetical protein
MAKKIAKMTFYLFVFSGLRFASIISVLTIGSMVAGGKAKKCVYQQFYCALCL